MRKITKLAARAFIEGREFRRDNTSVVIAQTGYGGVKRLLLHGNIIAIQDLFSNTRDPSKSLMRTKGNLQITLAGWPTTTTRERLNGLLTELGKREGIWQHKHEQYYGTHEDNIEINSNEWITVS
mgnify:FL=1